MASSTQKSARSASSDDTSLRVMSFGDHLEELRGRVLRTLLATGLGFCVALIFQDELLSLITEPHRQAMEVVGVKVELRHVTNELERASEALAGVPAAVGAAVASRGHERADLQDRLNQFRESLPTAQIDAVSREGFDLLARGLESLVPTVFEPGRYEELRRHVEVIDDAIEELAGRHFLQSDGDFDPARTALGTVAATLDEWRGSNGASRPAAPTTEDLRALDSAESEIVRARDRVARFAAGEGESTRLHFFSYPESFFAHLKVCALAALLLGLPWATVEAWRFIAAGLYPRERRAIRPFLPLSLMGTVVGAAFAYFVLIPVGLAYLGGYGSSELFETSFRLKEYLSLVLTLMIGMAVVFQLPLVMVFLARAGFTDAVVYRRYRKFSIIGALVVGSLLTPPDVVTQLLMAGPLVLLYESGIWATEFFKRRAG